MNVVCARNVTLQAISAAAMIVFAASANGQTGVPGGYALRQRLPLDGAGGEALELLEDQRITPAVQKQYWNSGRGALDDPEEIEIDDKALAVSITTKPIVAAQLRLVSATGAVLAERTLERPLAEIKAAPLHGLPWPTVFLTVDYKIEFGGYNGPITMILAPTRSKLDTVRYQEDKGPGGSLALLDALHASWKIVPARNGGVEEIEEITSRLKDSNGEGDDFVSTFTTFRFINGQWMATKQTRPGLLEDEGDFPPRSQFP